MLNIANLKNERESLLIITSVLKPLNSTLFDDIWYMKQVKHHLESVIIRLWLGWDLAVKDFYNVKGWIYTAQTLFFMFPFAYAYFGLLNMRTFKI